MCLLHPCPLSPHPSRLLPAHRACARAQPLPRGRGTSLCRVARCLTYLLAFRKEAQQLTMANAAEQWVLVEMVQALYEVGSAARAALGRVGRRAARCGPRMRLWGPGLGVSAGLSSGGRGHTLCAGTGCERSRVEGKVPGLTVRNAGVGAGGERRTWD